MNQRHHVLLAASALGAALAIGACAHGEMGGGGAPDCYTHPKTHLEIINACTTADEVDKTSNLPLLGPKGELPPLP